MVIYLDVLLLSNLWADYALLRATAAVLHAPLHRLRGVLAAFLGAASALIILLPPMPAAVCAAVRGLSAAGICAAAFGINSFRRLLRQTAVFLAVSLAFCGTVYALAQFRQPFGVYAQNSVIYADVSLLTLLLGTTAAAAGSVLLSRRSALRQHRSYRLHLRIHGMDFALPALADTGNSLRDTFTGTPVAVCAAASLSAWLSAYPEPAAAAAACKGFRMLPVRTVAGERLLPVFQPDAVYLQRTDTAADEHPVALLIAVSEELTGASAIVPACVIS